MSNIKATCKYQYHLTIILTSLILVRPVHQRLRAPPRKAKYITAAKETITPFAFTF